MLLSLPAPTLIMAESVSFSGAYLRCTVMCQANTDALQPTGVNDMMAGRSVKLDGQFSCIVLGMCAFIAADKE